MRPYEQVVRAGVAFLDKERPGWEQHIDLDTLELNDCGTCVLGQLLNDYDRGLMVLQLGEHFGERAISLGFVLQRFTTRYRELTNEWKRQIEEKRLAESESYFVEVPHV